MNASRNHKLTNDTYKQESKNLLKPLGIDLQRDWFVTLHARESGYAENKNSEREFFRNGNIDDYNLAIDFIIKSGGKVVRVGDKSMSKITKSLKGYFIKGFYFQKT